jgi:hypothetical protein
MSGSGRGILPIGSVGIGIGVAHSWLFGWVAESRQATENGQRRRLFRSAIVSGAGDVGEVSHFHGFMAGMVSSPRSPGRPPAGVKGKENACHDAVRGCFFLFPLG